ncbi:hypothetical protein GOP47_0004505, partial [Adiantum capillus-veneris]
NRRLIELTNHSFAQWHRNHIEQRRRNYSKFKAIFLKSGDTCNEWNVSRKAEHARLRQEFLTRARLQHPQLLRLIDIDATCRQGRRRVVLIDYWADAGTVQQVGYTAISHTYGMDIYKVFDCPCASECSANERPRCSNEPCPHHDDASSLVGVAGHEKHKRALNDILRMCDILSKAEVKYAWHDGVCISQHDEDEVNETIKHMGWIYANANDTVIFLHYIGNPMAPVGSSKYFNELCCRWHTRVWTLQEAALSKCRRYCVREGPLGDCQIMEEFEEKIAQWYGDDSSTIKILEEERFFEFVKEIHRVLCSVCLNLAEKVLSIPNDADDDVIVESNWMWRKAYVWNVCTWEVIQNLHWTCLEFPTMYRVLCICSARDSKHRGDKVNSILALAGVKDFVAQKDVNLEASTIEFFKRQGQAGLAKAVFCVNGALEMKDKQYITEERRHTWQPVLWSTVTAVAPEGANDLGIEFNVMEDDRMEMRGELKYVKVQFTVHEYNTNCGQISGDDDIELPALLICHRACTWISLNLRRIYSRLAPFPNVLWAIAWKFQQSRDV